MIMLVVKNTTNNTTYTMQELNTFFINIALNGIISKVSFSKTFPLHFFTNLSVILFLHLQFL